MCLFSQTESHYVAQAGLELLAQVILSPQTPKMSHHAQLDFFFFLRQILTVSPRLESSGSGMILGDCKFYLSGSSKSPASASPVLGSQVCTTMPG